MKMKKTEFLDALSRGLSSLPKREREERVNFYREMIEDRIEEGIPEEEAVAGVGTVDGIVSQILSERPAVVGEPQKKSGGRVGLILLLVLVFPVWFPLLLALFVSIVSALFSFFVTLWAVELSLAAGAIGGVGSFFVLLFTGQFAPAFFTLGAALVSGGLAILLFFGAVAVTKALGRGIAQVVRILFGWMKRKEKNNDQIA